MTLDAMLEDYIFFYNILHDLEKLRFKQYDPYIATPVRIRVNVKNVVGNDTCKYCGSLLLEGDGEEGTRNV